MGEEKFRFCGDCPWSGFTDRDACPKCETKFFRSTWEAEA